jgi:hypothetical protein
MAAPIDDMECEREPARQSSYLVVLFGRIFFGSICKRLTAQDPIGVNMRGCKGHTRFGAVM